MGSKQQRIQAEKRRRAQQTGLTLELFDHDKSDCGCDIEDVSVEIEPRLRVIRQLLHYNEHRHLVWFAIIYVAMEDDRGTELYSVDTGHGHLHEHTTGHRQRNDRKNICPLYSHVDVQQSFDTAYDLVMNKHLAMSGR